MLNEPPITAAQIPPKSGCPSAVRLCPSTAACVSDNAPTMTASTVIAVIGPHVRFLTWHLLARGSSIDFGSRSERNPEPQLQQARLIGDVRVRRRRPVILEAL